VSEFLTLTEEDDDKLFRVRVLNTGEERIARYHRHVIGGISLKFPCFADRTTRTTICAGSTVAGVRWPSVEFNPQPKVDALNPCGIRPPCARSM
jgi:hypothetical protein